MELVVDFKKQYSRFLDRNNSSGVCMGFCMVWLGDVFKNRHMQSGFFSKWAPKWLASPSVAGIPCDDKSLDTLFQRAHRRYNNYYLYTEVTDPFNCLTTDEMVVNYKNKRQMTLAKEGGVAGLKYSYRKLDNLFSAKGLNYTGILQGTIINFCWLKTDDSHAVAVMSISPTESYFLDPNFGLYKINREHMVIEICNILESNYSNIRVESQIIISRK